MEDELILGLLLEEHCISFDPQNTLKSVDFSTTIMKIIIERDKLQRDYDKLCRKYIMLKQELKRN